MASLTVDELLQEIQAFRIPVPDCRILVVDDEDVVRELLTALLSGEGLPVLQASSGNEALRAISASAPRVVITDKNLPDVSGLEVVRRGKAASPETEFLVITGYASMETAVEALDAGACGYLCKPFDQIEDVLVRVRAALERTRVRAQNQLLGERLRGAYEELFKAKVELEMMNEVLAEKLRLQNRELRDVVRELLRPLSGMEADVASLLSFADDAARGQDVAGRAMVEVGRVRMLLDLLATVHRRNDDIDRRLQGDLDLPPR